MVSKPPGCSMDTVFIGRISIFEPAISHPGQMYRTVMTEENLDEWADANPGNGEDELVLPLDARMVLTALESAGWEKERRQQRRNAYRVKATLRMFADAPAARSRVLYTRDASHRGVGFITREMLPLGYGGMLRLPSPKSSKSLNIACTLCRCRMASRDGTRAHCISIATRRSFSSTNRIRTTTTSLWRRDRCAYTAGDSVPGGVWCDGC